MIVKIGSGYPYNFKEITCYEYSFSNILYFSYSAFSASLRFN